MAKENNEEFLRKFRQAYEQQQRKEVERWYRGQLSHEASERKHTYFWLLVIGVPAVFLAIITFIVELYCLNP